MLRRGQRNRRKRTLSEESKHPVREREAKELALHTVQCIRVSRESIGYDETGLRKSPLLLIYQLPHSMLSISTLETKRERENLDFPGYAVYTRATTGQNRVFEATYPTRKRRKNIYSVETFVNVNIVDSPNINVKNLTHVGYIFFKERAPGHLKSSRSFLGLHTCAPATDPKITRERGGGEASLLVKLDLVHAPDGFAI